MTQASENFLVSVANVVIRDPDTLVGLAYGRANLNTSFSMTNQKTEVRGGINNPIRFVYMHDKAIEIKIEQVVFTKELLALNAGSLVSNASVTVLGAECVQLSSGVGTVVNTPTGNVTVFLPDGTIQTVTPSTKTITVSGGGDDQVQVTYEYTTAADRLSIETTKPPSVVNLTLLSEVRNNSGVITEQLQMNIPKFQTSGNFTLSLAANGVSTEALDGFALNTAGTTCTAGEIYGTVTWVPVSTSTVDYAEIYATPSPVVFSAADVNDTQQLKVMGVRGGLYVNTDVTTLCSYAKDVGGSAHLSVGASNGLIAMASGSAGDVATITATYVNSTGGSIYDAVPVIVTA